MVGKWESGLNLCIPPTLTSPTIQPAVLSSLFSTGASISGRAKALGDGGKMVVNKVRRGVSAPISIPFLLKKRLPFDLYIIRQALLYIIGQV